MAHSEDRRDRHGDAAAAAGTGGDPTGGDLQSDEAWADAGAGNARRPEPGGSDEGPSFEDPNDR